MAQQDLNQIQFRTYKSGQHSRINESRTFVIRNERQWQEYWARSTGESFQSAPKDINWVTEELLAVHLGERRSGGHSVYVGGIRRQPNGKLRVSVVEQRPGPGVITTQALTYPYVILRMPRHYAEYEFERSIDETTTVNPDPRPIPPKKTCNCDCDCG